MSENFSNTLCKEYRYAFYIRLEIFFPPTHSCMVHGALCMINNYVFYFCLIRFIYSFVDKNAVAKNYASLYSISLDLK